MRSPRYTTYSDDQLVAIARKLVPAGQPVPDARTLRQKSNGAATPDSNTRIDTVIGGRTRLLKEHTCAVSYPDGANGICRYVRIGPEWHFFHYRHQGSTEAADKDSGDDAITEPCIDNRFLTGSPLPTQRVFERMANTPEAIETKSRELAGAAFADAVTHEQKDRFRRATPPGGNKPDSALFQFSAKRAKEIGGRYALCQRVGKRLLPYSALFATLAEANAAWEARGNSCLTVACACRWTRQWETPRFNPLYGRFPCLQTND